MLSILVQNEGKMSAERGVISKKTRSPDNMQNNIPKHMKNRKFKIRELKWKKEKILICQFAFLLW